MDWILSTIEELEALMEKYTLREIEMRDLQAMRDQGFANGVTDINLLLPHDFIRLVLVKSSRRKEAICDFFRLFLLIRQSTYKRGVSGSEHINRELSKAKMPSEFVTALCYGDLDEVFLAIQEVSLTQKQINVLAELIDQARGKQADLWLSQRKRLKKALA